MTCDTCGGDTSVIDSRKLLGNIIRRRRKCLRCGARVSTFEISEAGFFALRSMRQAIRKLGGVTRDLVDAVEVLGELPALTEVSLGPDRMADTAAPWAAAGRAGTSLRAGTS
jgi:hypothetical protein